MSHVLDANLIRVFDFYLAAMFVFGFLRRWAVYRDGVLLAIALRARWPRLLARLAEHRAVLLDWAVVRPTALALALTVTQMIVSRGIFPQAKIQVGELFDPWWRAVLMAAAAGPMLAIDAYFLICIGRFDRAETEKYFDMAEGWAGSLRARVVRVVTFGRIDPDRMVDEQVRSGLAQVGATIGWSMMWVSYQIAARMLCGLTIWALWAFTD
jgi:hypothetical protein